MKKTLLAVLAILTLLTGCSKSKNRNTVFTDGLTSMEKVIGILGEVFTENNKGFGGVLR
jgi:nitrous oxide reductase accessory protein NosL